MGTSRRRTPPRRAAPAAYQDYDEARAILREEPLFECLSDSQINNLVKEAGGFLPGKQYEMQYPDDLPGLDSAYGVCDAASQFVTEDDVAETLLQAFERGGGAGEHHASRLR